MGKSDQALPEPGQGGCLVPELAPLLPGRCHQPGGEVGEAHPALGPVLVLSALSPCHEALDSALGKEFLIGLRNRNGVG